MRHKHYVTRREKRQRKRVLERLRKLLVREMHPFFGDASTGFNRLTRKRERRLYAGREEHYRRVIFERLVCNHARERRTAEQEGRTGG